jgi:hypothetical protein
MECAADGDAVMVNTATPGSSTPPVGQRSKLGTMPRSIRTRSPKSARCSGKALSCLRCVELHHRGGARDRRRHDRRSRSTGLSKRAVGELSEMFLPCFEAKSAATFRLFYALRHLPRYPAPRLALAAAWRTGFSLCRCLLVNRRAKRPPLSAARVVQVMSNDIWN